MAPTQPADFTRHSEAGIAECCDGSITATVVSQHISSHTSYTHKVLYTFAQTPNQVAPPRDEPRSHLAHVPVLELVRLQVLGPKDQARGRKSSLCNINLSQNAGSIITLPFGKHTTREAGRCCYDVSLPRKSTDKSCNVKLVYLMKLQEPQFSCITT